MKIKTKGMTSKKGLAEKPKVKEVPNKKGSNIGKDWRKR